MTQEQKNNPLHGVKLEALMTELVDHYGWKKLSEAMNLNCFKSNPSIKSSLKFLRKTEWAREKVERFYLYDYKGLPQASDAEYDTPPRKRHISKPASQSAQARSPEPASKPKPPHSIKPAHKPAAPKSSSAFNPWTSSKVGKE